MGIRGDLVMMRTAVNRGYPITDDMRAKMVELIQQIQNDPLEGTREKLAANRLLLSADMANETLNKNEREAELILLLAEQHGVKDEVLRLIGERQGGNIGDDVSQG